MQLNLSDIVVFLIFALFLNYWWQSKAIKEKALLAVKQYCGKMDIQLLNDTIGISSTRLIWHKGAVKIRRCFTFEFTSTGKARYEGNIIFIKSALESISLDPHHI